MATAKTRADRVSACQKWSLGDLVLAKISGFPAMPAKIIKPEDYGQRHDPKKVFVHFFGDNQVGFCSPFDIQTFTLDLKNELTAQFYGKPTSFFTRAVEEICEEYDKLENKKRDIIPEIHEIKTTTSIDSLTVTEKMPFQHLKMHEVEVTFQTNDRFQTHCEMAVKKNDLNTEVHRQVHGQKKRGNIGASDCKEGGEGETGGEEDNGGVIQGRGEILTSALDQCRQEREEARTERDKLESELDKVNEELMTKRARTDNLQVELDAVKQELDRAHEELTTKRARTDNLQDELDAVKEELDIVHEELMTKRASTDNLQVELDAVKQELLAAKAQGGNTVVKRLKLDREYWRNLALALQDDQHYQPL